MKEREGGRRAEIVIVIGVAGRVRLSPNGKTTRTHTHTHTHTERERNTHTYVAEFVVLVDRHRTMLERRQL